MALKLNVVDYKQTNMAQGHEQVQATNGGAFQRLINTAGIGGIGGMDSATPHASAVPGSDRTATGGAADQRPRHSAMDPPTATLAARPAAIEQTRRPGSKQASAGSGMDWGTLAPTKLVLGASSDLSAGMPQYGGFVMFPFSESAPDGSPRHIRGFVTQMNNPMNSGLQGYGNFALKPGELQAGHGMVAALPVRRASGGIVPDVAVFVHTSTGISPIGITPKGSWSIGVTLGVVGSMDQMAASALKLAGPKVLALGFLEPTVAGQGLGAAMLAAGTALDVAGQFGTAWGGVGWNAEARWMDGEFLGFYRDGQIIDLNAMVQGARVQTATLLPAQAGMDLPLPKRQDNVPALTGLNLRLHTHLQLLHGNPWHIAHGANGLNHGNRALALANTFYSVLREHDVLGRHERINDNAHAGKLLDDLSQALAGNHPAWQAAMGRLANGYGLDFGSPDLAFVNGLHRLAMAAPPSDEHYVVSVFRH